jgi:hypothetical protein
VGKVFPLSVICSECPIETDKPHILAETGFLQFKEQVFFKCKNRIPAVQCEREPFN